MFKINAVPEIQPRHGYYGANEETCWDQKDQTEISQIFVSADNFSVNSIQFQYVQNDSLKLSRPYGEKYGPKFYPVRLDYPSEFLTRVSGKYNSSGVKSIMFTTNRRTFGPYGCNNREETEFDFRFGEKQQFGGFHGSYKQSGLRSIGVYFNPNITIAATPEVLSEEI